MTDIKDMDRSLGYYPPKDPVEMPAGALRNAPSAGDVVGRLDVTRGTCTKSVNLYCDSWYWSESYGCFFIVTYYLQPFDNVPGTKRKELRGKLLRGWGVGDPGRAPGGSVI